TLYVDGLAASPVKATGRYFQYEADFTGNYANARNPPEDSYPNIRALHDVVSPKLRQTRIYYRPARGMVISGSVSPSQLRNWKSVSYETDLTAGGAVQVDVLDENDVPLFSDVPSGFALEGLDPRHYPRLRLRGFVDNGGVDTKRPVLLSWKLSWDILTEPLMADRNSLSVSRGELLTLTVVLDAAREGVVAVHDASGQLLRTFARGTIPAGVSRWTWDGRNESGVRAAPGVCFVSLAAGPVRKIKSIAVLP
ncbi:MAG: FlgD immunoglobulin-like domain containing protein, partial [bacterium]